MHQTVSKALIEYAANQQPVKLLQFNVSKLCAVESAMRPLLIDYVLFCVGN